MKMLAVYGAGALLVALGFGQQALTQVAPDSADALLDAQLNQSFANGLRIAESVTGGNNGVASVSLTLLVGAFVPVLYRIVQIAGEAFTREHQLSVDKRRKAANLSRDT